ncbi:hypothetical protein C7974DRAFT_374900 [Boeremia exigua]|uniref:uncharacterized protein n=1 Tax=Boeremia exigua TaxID=749465 RepID=UPI001E8DB8C0|nr:uncharacterized protein C7974DRAFT_374900 [Boeremia exigua]KAH6638353.1 hypothetical protein C7974DRAFT_374900 [Boeremia exigua]
MPSTPLVLTLAILTATILVLLIIWLFIRYTKVRHAHHTSHALMPHEEISTADNGESTVQLYNTYRPTGAPQAAGDAGVELQYLRVRDCAEGEKAEVWLQRGTSRGGMRAGGAERTQPLGRVKEEEQVVLGTRTVRM